MLVSSAVQPGGNGPLSKMAWKIGSVVDIVEAFGHVRRDRIELIN